jgi:hypothetical protein
LADGGVGGHSSPILASRIQPANLRRVKLFWTLFSIDGAIALIVLFFFFAGLGDGSVSSFNMTLWLAILGGLAAILGGGLLLKSNGHPYLACGVLLILAVPGLLYAVFILSVIILQPRWN